MSSGFVRNVCPSGFVHDVAGGSRPAPGRAYLHPSVFELFLGSNVEAVRAACPPNADFNQPDKSGRLPLQCLVQRVSVNASEEDMKTSIELARWMIERGAEPGRVAADDCCYAQSIWSMVKVGLDDEDYDENNPHLRKKVDFSVPFKEVSALSLAAMIKRRMIEEGCDDGDGDISNLDLIIEAMARASERLEHVPVSPSTIALWEALSTHRASQDVVLEAAGGEEVHARARGCTSHLAELAKLGKSAVNRCTRTRRCSRSPRPCSPPRSRRACARGS